MLTSCKGPAEAVEVVKEEAKPEVTEPSEPKLNEFGMPILMEYEPMHISLGDVVRGEKRDIEFVYTNIVNEDVVIEIVSACSCTETEFTVGRVEPGKQGKILLTFDSTSKKKSETIDVDIILANTDPKNGYPIVDRVTFDYRLVDEKGNEINEKEDGEH